MQMLPMMVARNLHRLFIYKNDEKIIFAYGIIDYWHSSIGGTRF